MIKGRGQKSIEKSGGCEPFVLHDVASAKQRFYPERLKGGMNLRVQREISFLYFHVQ
ncbi:hypothetical protein [Syntrophorhabdus aromaticivorans]|uniref:Uncharacterized protein n=1 Tax=Syntrophorhabdus aromaticivorans TaxID=328301 RepID=A0A971M4Z2_9BACT|nr:hypothetical protein [Syntrophorhabdus aromaticivorans]NLW36118.1 hypothetical protein [Syntrophorhabdus aromaticivorans]